MNMDYKHELVITNEIHSIEVPDPNTTIVVQIPVSCFKGYMDEEEDQGTIGRKRSKRYGYLPSEYRRMMEGENPAGR